MDYLRILRDFNVKLVTSLPMKDVVFLATLNQKGLFSGDLKAGVKAKPTATEAADYFLDNKIEKDLINGNTNSFLQLLSAMEEYSSLKPLVTEIHEVLRLPVLNKAEESSDVTCKFQIIYCIIYLPMWIYIILKFSTTLGTVVDCTETSWSSARHSIPTVHFLFGMTCTAGC